MKLHFDTIYLYRFQNIQTQHIMVNTQLKMSLIWLTEKSVEEMWKEEEPLDSTSSKNLICDINCLFKF